ncbi:MAG TPA: FadR/GntR family transcriptional regulator [Syntrophomonadaceae bacterium]|nr:FadR/GntR family transcriptional regulator [Syntrophomonadaceae bacterium]
MYQPISRTSEAQSIRLYEIIIKRIKNMILEGELKVGDKLPSERELADMFQVSRVPVREALKIMEFMELVQYIPGDGIYLKYIDINDLVSKIDFMIETSSDIISDLFEARQAIELKTIELAAIKRTDADLQVMGQIIAEMEQDINNGGDGVKAATNFHTAISKASKNKVLARINDLLVNLTIISREKSLKRTGEASIALTQHKQMFDMIKNHNVKEAKKVMENHLEHNKQSALADKN